MGHLNLMAHVLILIFIYPFTKYLSYYSILSQWKTKDIYSLINSRDPWSQVACILLEEIDSDQVKK